jgi:hypothetical protein
VKTNHAANHGGTLFLSPYVATQIEDCDEWEVFTENSNT